MSVPEPKAAFGQVPYQVGKGPRADLDLAGIPSLCQSGASRNCEAVTPPLLRV